MAKKTKLTRRVSSSVGSGPSPHLSRSRVPATLSTRSPFISGSTSASLTTRRKK